MFASKASAYIGGALSGASPKCMLWLNLQQFEKSYGVSPCEAFTLHSNVYKQG
jgi:hypothetical protein